MLKPPGKQSAVLGAACCIASALAYTAVNACKRLLTVSCDRPLTLCVQDSVSVAVVGAWLFWQARRGKAVFPAWPALLAVVVVGLTTVFLGNLPVMWAMSVVGLAVAITAVLSMMLVGAALFGRIFLGERVTLQSAAALSLLIVSVVLIGFGAGQTNDSLTATTNVDHGPFWVVVAVSVACIAGLVYAAAGVTLRKMMIGGTPLTAVLFIVPVVGVFTLGPISVCRLGLAGVLETRVTDLEIMLASGALNLLGYLACLQGLRFLHALHANVLSASQVAMAAVTGLLFFHERASLGLVLGVILTVVGMTLLDRPESPVKCPCE